MDGKTAAVTLKNITKTFGSTVANDKVSLEINKGEILSLLGENGSGKTTLMNMLSGIYFPDEGQIFINGKEEVIRSPKDAFDLGIGMVHQHFKLIDVLTATENIILGLKGKLNIKAATKKIQEICDKYGFEIDPNQKIYDMTAEWLSNSECSLAESIAINQNDDLKGKFLELSSSEYKLVTKEILALFNWVKRFAVSEIDTE